MKKLIASILSLTIALSATCVAMAADNKQNESSTELIEVNQELYGAKTTHTGTVKQIEEGFITLDNIDLQFNIGDSTYVGDYSLAPYAGLKVGDEVLVVADTATTRSIPAQTYASYILVKTGDELLAPIYATVKTNDGKDIMSDDGQNRIVISDETKVTSQILKIALKAKDITPGSEIFVYATHVGLSLPAYVVPQNIVVMKLAEAESEDDSADAPYMITVDGDMVLDTSALPYTAYNKGTSVMVPLRIVAETLGYKVAWDAGSGKITVSSDTYIAELSSASNIMKLTDKRLSSQNTKEVTLAETPSIQEGYTYVPLSFFTSFDNTVSVNGSSIAID